MILALKCAGCGAALEITPDMDQFACGYCGLSQRVDRNGGTVSLKRLEAVVQKIQDATASTAAELALPRLKRELAAIDKEKAPSCSFHRRNSFGTAMHVAGLKPRGVSSV